MLPSLCLRDVIAIMSYIRKIREKLGHELLMVPSAAAIIRDADGRLLLQEKMSSESWSLPAGAIEPSETPEEAIKREVREETGYIVSVDKLIGVFGGMSFRHTYPNGDEVEYVVALFACSIIGGDGVPTDAETSSVRYFAAADMPQLALPYPATALFGP